MERTWSTENCKHTNTPDKMVQLGCMFNDLEWLDVNEVTKSDAMNVAIHGLRIPNVSHIAISNAMAPYGLIGIRGNFPNGWANIYLCHDKGNNLVVLAADFQAVEEMANHKLN